MNSIFFIQDRHCVPASDDIADSIGLHSNTSPNDLRGGLFTKGFIIAEETNKDYPLHAFIRSTSEKNEVSLVVEFDDPILGMTYYAIDRHLDYLKLLDILIPLVNVSLRSEQNKLLRDIIIAVEGHR